MNRQINIRRLLCSLNKIRVISLGLWCLLQPWSSFAQDDANPALAQHLFPRPHAFAVLTPQFKALNTGPLSFTTHLYLDFADTTLVEEVNSDFDVAERANTVGLDPFNTTLGSAFSYSFNHSWGALTPFGRFEWVHEFDTTVDNWLNNSNERDYFNLGFSISARFGDDQSQAAFLSYERVFGSDDEDDYSLTGGLRFEF